MKKKGLYYCRQNKLGNSPKGRAAADDEISIRLLHAQQKCFLFFFFSGFIYLEGERRRRAMDENGACIYVNKEREK